jgi:hypothetical protein
VQNQYLVSRLRQLQRQLESSLQWRGVAKVETRRHSFDNCRRAKVCGCFVESS